MNRAQHPGREGPTARRHAVAVDGTVARTASLLDELISWPRLVVALIFVWVAAAVAFFVDLALPVPDGWGGVACAVAFWAAYALVPLSPIGERTTAPLLWTVVRPAGAPDAAPPALVRVVGAAACLVLALPIVGVVRALPGSGAAIDLAVAGINQLGYGLACTVGAWFAFRRRRRGCPTRRQRRWTRT